MYITFVIFLIIFEVRGRGDYFFEPVINITTAEQEVKVEGCAKPHLTLAFASPIKVSLSAVSLLRSI